MPLKPIKFGFKVYMLAESKSGYILNWVIHEGKKDTLIDLSSLVKVQKQCPENIKIYSENSKGVDLFDQKISYYLYNHSSVRWFWRIVIHLLSVALHNSFFI